jgi:hypothetical protein
MKKIWAIIAIFLLIFVLGFLFFNGIQTVSTNKNVYSIGEKIIVSSSVFKFYRCSCMGPKIKFYRQTPGGWTPIEIYPEYFRPVCVNGTAEMGPLPCDIVWCGLSFSESRYNYTWNSKIYERIGETETCKFPEWFDAEFPIPSYNLLIAPAGKYKVRFGIAEKAFEIR